ncbi:uncharacterized protein LOC125947581 [Dermacentor silvarum]|uniref:uncharacterized protein LOC125947581 n=1 Tax=Dermacentor silvarum TaxID=543639 RepID=UPI002100A530|nr:uncharacterized protein LOC125947581 [Dermacentor silvarum]
MASSNNDGRTIEHYLSTDLERLRLTDRATSEGLQARDNAEAHVELCGHVNDEPSTSEARGHRDIFRPIGQHYTLPPCPPSSPQLCRRHRARLLRRKMRFQPFEERPRLIRNLVTQRSFWMPPKIRQALQDILDTQELEEDPSALNSRRPESAPASGIATE